MVSIVHISDLHYGCGDFKMEYMDNVINYINTNKDSIDIVVCTGDLTNKGRHNQYMEISNILKRIEVPMINVPGNTDVKNSGIIFFEQFFGPRRTKKVLEDKETIILGIRSPKDDLKKGEVGPEQIKWVIAQLKKHPLKNRILALHHHLVDVPYSGKSWNTVRDAGDLLELTQLFEVDLVLMGHKHVPHAWMFGITTLLYCGTSASLQVKAAENPSFNYIQLEDEDVEVYTIDSTNLEKDLLLRRKRGVVEFIRPRKTRLEHLIQSDVYK